MPALPGHCPVLWEGAVLVLSHAVTAVKVAKPLVTIEPDVPFIRDTYAHDPTLRASCSKLSVMQRK